ncbi:hypothetical protein [Flammeovirga sp. OC4]|uniref:hypothetical protein n=1 Tax=Flammeovirga sp. OC4 TaxID=1382345 RepID=UPI0005C69F56|nr:hypothetical protein [Flammeovirga sp. OC4]
MSIGEKIWSAHINNYSDMETILASYSSASEADSELLRLIDEGYSHEAALYKMFGSTISLNINDYRNEVKFHPVVMEEKNGKPQTFSTTYEDCKN